MASLGEQVDYNVSHFNSNKPEPNKFKFSKWFLTYDQLMAGKLATHVNLKVVLKHDLHDPHLLTKLPNCHTWVVLSIRQTLMQTSDTFQPFCDLRGNSSTKCERWANLSFRSKYIFQRMIFLRLKQVKNKNSFDK